MRSTDRLGMAVMVAMMLSLTALTPVTSDRRLYFDCLLMIGVIGFGGVVARRLLPTDLIARLVQAGVACVVLAGLAISQGLTSPFALPGVLNSALRWTVESSAPMAANLGVRMVAVFSVSLLAYLADTLTVSLGHPAWSLMPLGVPYLISAVALPALVSFWPVLWLTVGYLMVLLADAANRNRLLRFQASEGPRWSMLLGGLASLVSALLFAGIAGVVTPGLDPNRGAPFTGQGPVQMGDPSLDLRRNLQQPEDRRVLTYTTSGGSGVYLRMTSLPGFDASGFHLNAIDLFGGNLPSPPGVSSGRARFTISVTVEEFNSEWLPLPYAPATFDAAGDWRHDPLSLSVLASGARQKQATNSLRYDATVIDVNPTAEELVKAAAGTPTDVSATGQVPADLPERIKDLAEQITRDGTTAGRKALLLQDWLRSSLFTYSVDPAPGSGYDALTRFLFEERTGYCEQFATSMAVLARAIGIPARVAVGFLPGSRVGDVWEVSTRDMHAWPELYLAGLGWVGFEPTPGVAVPPSYTTDPGTQQSPSPSASATPTPSSVTESPSAEPSTPIEEPGSSDEQSVDLTWVGWVAGGLALVALAMAPAAVRRARRARRLTVNPPREAVTAAWDEVRDSVWDAGGRWPQGSARQIGGEIARELPEDASVAMGRVAVLVEQARYADTIGDVSGLSGDVQQVRAGMGHTRRDRWAWLRSVFPPSLWRGLWWRG